MNLLDELLSIFSRSFAHSLSTKISYYKYNSGLQALPINTSLTKYVDYIKSNVTQVKDPIITLDELTMATMVQSFFTCRFILHPIPVITPESLKDLEEKIKYTNDTGKIISITDEHTEYKSPFELPISPYNTTPFNADTHKKIIAYKRELYYEISMPFPLGIYSPTLYAHEITHTQISKGTINDFRNCEVLSIFIEKLFTYMQTYETFKQIESRRLLCLPSHLEILKNNTRDFYQSMYIESTIKAERLFDLFINSDEATKIMILKLIQEIFDGNITVEDLLEQLNITYENSLDIDIIQRNLSI